jgi:hypothetical protein
LEKEMNEYCEDCGEEMDHDCMGNDRCPVCDPPCPHCSDDDGSSIFDDMDDEDDTEDSWDAMDWQESCDADMG